VPSSMFTRALDPPETFGGLGVVARHIGEIGAGHRFRRTAAAGACSTGVHRGRDEYYGKYPQQGFLAVCLMPHSSQRRTSAP
jgi:hypothetical protein